VILKPVLKGIHGSRLAYFGVVELTPIEVGIVNVALTGMPPPDFVHRPKTTTPYGGFWSGAPAMFLYLSISYARLGLAHELPTEVVGCSLQKAIRSLRGGGRRMAASSGHKVSTQ
jgi:hypothetical protein